MGLNFTVRNGTTYTVKVALPDDEASTPNQTIIDALTARGFDEVTATGVSNERDISAHWPLSDVMLPMPEGTYHIIQWHHTP